MTILTLSTYHFLENIIQEWCFSDFWCGLQFLQVVVCKAYMITFKLYNVVSQNSRASQQLVTTFWNYWNYFQVSHVAVFAEFDSRGFS